MKPPLRGDALRCRMKKKEVMCMDDVICDAIEGTVRERKSRCKFAKDMCTHRVVMDAQSRTVCGDVFDG